MKAFPFLFRLVSVCYLRLVARRRRLQKLRNRVELLNVLNRSLRDQNTYLSEQVAGYRDAFQSIQIGYQALGAANQFDRDRLTKPKTP